MKRFSRQQVKTAQVLPLSAKYRNQIESSLSKFIFQSRHKRLRLDELENSYENGSLGLPNIAVKADLCY